MWITRCSAACHVVDRRLVAGVLCASVRVRGYSPLQYESSIRRATNRVTAIVPERTLHIFHPRHHRGHEQNQQIESIRSGPRNLSRPYSQSVSNHPYLRSDHVKRHSSISTSSSHASTSDIQPPPTSATTRVFPISVVDLGLEATFIRPYLSTLQALPEIQHILGSFSTRDNQRQHPAQLAAAGTFIDPANEYEINLRRAIDIFKALPPAMGTSTQVSYNTDPGLSVYARAVTVWLACYLAYQARYHEAIHALSQVLSKPNCPSSFLDLSTLELRLAIAKLHWLAGDFQNARDVCDQLLGATLIPDDDSRESHDHRDEKLLAAEESYGIHGRLEASAAIFPVHYASVRTGQAISRLCLAQSLDDLFSVRDPFRMVTKYLEQHAPSAITVRAMAQLNLGLAELIYSDEIAAHHGYNNEDLTPPSNADGIERKEKMITNNIPIDGAMRAWKEGLSLIQRSKNTKCLNQREKGARAILEAQLSYHMGWGLLHRMSSGNDRVLTQASKYAKEALGLYDSAWPILPETESTSSVSTRVAKDGFIATLTLVAQCYHRAGAAVTAEGILNSAVPSTQIIPNLIANDGRGVSPIDQLPLVEASRAYAELLGQWEKRDADAKQWDEYSKRMVSCLPIQWQALSTSPGNGRHSMFWFWTPGSLQ